MKLKNQKEVGNQHPLQTQFDIQKKQFKKSQIPSQTIVFYFTKLQSQNLLEIHFGLLGIKHTLNSYYYKLDRILKNTIDLLIPVMNFVQQDLCPEITKRSLSILALISEYDPLLFIRNCGVQTLLNSHLTRNSKYFPKIIKILSDIDSEMDPYTEVYMEVIQRIREARLIIMIIDFIKGSQYQNSKHLDDILFGLFMFVDDKTDQCTLAQIYNFYEESLISRNRNLKHSFLLAIGQLLEFYTPHELNPKSVESLFSLYEECDQNDKYYMIEYFKMISKQDRCNDQLIQFGLFDFLYEKINLQTIDILIGIKLIFKCVYHSQERANKLVNHKVFQIILDNVQRLQIFGYLIRVIELINFESLQNLIQNGFLRVMKNFLKKLTKRIKGNLYTIVPILQYIINTGKATFIENYFLIEIKQLGIVEILDCANVLYFDNNSSYKLTE